MSYGRSDLYDINVELMFETDKAWLVSDGTIVDGEQHKVWIPKSQAELERAGPGKPLWTLTAPQWLLKSKNLL